MVIHTPTSWYFTTPSAGFQTSPVTAAHQFISFVTLVINILTVGEFAFIAAFETICYETRILAVFIYISNNRINRLSTLMEAFLN